MEIWSESAPAPEEDFPNWFLILWIFTVVRPECHVHLPYLSKLKNYTELKVGAMCITEKVACAIRIRYYAIRR